VLYTVTHPSSEELNLRYSVTHLASEEVIRATGMLADGVALVQEMTHQHGKPLELPEEHRIMAMAGLVTLESLNELLEVQGIIENPVEIAKAEDYPADPVLYNSLLGCALSPVLTFDQRIRMIEYWAEQTSNGDHRINPNIQFALLNARGHLSDMYDSQKSNSPTISALGEVVAELRARKLVVPAIASISKLAFNRFRPIQSSR